MADDAGLASVGTNTTVGDPSLSSIPRIGTNSFANNIFPGSSSIASSLTIPSTLGLSSNNGQIGSSRSILFVSIPPNSSSHFSFISTPSSR